MNKFEDSVIKTLKKNAIENEIIILSCENDVGLEEYLEKKARAIMEQRCIYSSYEENILMLEYPQADHPDANIFNKFFESVAVVSGNALFEGVFAIDVTNYIGALENPKFKELLNFIGKNSDTVYCIVAYTKNENAARKLFNALSTVSTFKMRYVNLPSKEKLTEYTVTKLREVLPHISPDIIEYFNSYYAENQYGYEFAEYILRVARNCDIKDDADFEFIKKLVEDAQEISKTGTVSVTIGF